MFSRRTTTLGAMPNYFASQAGVFGTGAAQNAVTRLQQSPTYQAAAASNPAMQAALFPAPLPSPGPDYVKMALIGGGALLGIVLLWKAIAPRGPAPLPVYQNPGPRRRNPTHTRTERLKRAVAAYEGFHWGDTPDKFTKKRFAKPPKVGVKLGKLVSVAYETRKSGERAVWEHEFGEEGGKRPDLVMDADNKRLFIVGGDYDVRDEGIID